METNVIIPNSQVTLLFEGQDYSLTANAELIKEVLDKYFSSLSNSITSFPLPDKLY